MAAAFPVRVISPERVLFEGDAEMVACRTQVGEIAFLANHVPLVGALDVCKVRIVPAEGGSESAFAVKGGFVEVRSNQVVILVDVAVPVDEVDAELLDQARSEATGGQEGGDEPAPASGDRDAKWAKLVEELVRS